VSTPIEDEFTELVDADIPRVDLVDKAANGTTFLIAKQADGSRGLFAPDFVRDLIGKTAEPEPDREETVTMTGSPGAIAKLMHEAAQRARQREEVAKEKYDTADRKHLAATGAAMPDGSYPIADEADLDRAIHAVGRGGGSHDAVRRHIIQRAKSLGASSKIPDNWAADGSLKEVTKMVVDAELDDGVDGLDPTVPLAEPGEEAPGSPTEPGSPAWEAIDAATACKWTSILARAKAAIDILAEREMLEAATADPDDAENAMDLQDACCAIDYAISVLAPFAVAEQAESDMGAMDVMAAVGKAVAGFDTAPLDTIEALGTVTKAGRVLSAANEAAIRQAAESLQKVLASLPAAPIEKESGLQVAKTANEEADMAKPTPAADATADSGQEPAMGTAQAEPKPVAGTPVTEVGKADGEKTPMVVVYDQKGRLIGIADPEDITPVANAEADADDMDQPGDDAGDPGSEDAADQTPDLTPQPPAEAGTPADAPASSEDDDVTKSTHNSDTTSEEVLKSSFLAAVEQVFKTHSAAQNEAIATTGDAVLELAGMVETLKGRIGALEEQPAEPRVFTNGAVPPAAVLRGQDRGATQVDPAQVGELRKQLYRGATSGDQNKAAIDLQQLAIAKLQEIHHGGARQ
jgi:hypothetical protein